MRLITNLALHAILGSAIAALAASAAAAASVDAFLTLGPVKGEVACSGGGCDSNSNAADRHKDWIEISSYQWGGAAPSAAGVRVAAGDVNGDGRADAAVSEKRQHNPVTFSKALDRGSVTLNASVPACATGKHFDEATLVTRASRYVFQDVMITSCATSGSGGMPTESVSFNYSKVTSQASSAADRSRWDLKNGTK